MSSSVAGALEVTPVQHADERGLFLEWFREDAFTARTGEPFHVAQANVSVSDAGTLRGIHFAEVPPARPRSSPASRVRRTTWSSTSASDLPPSASGTPC